MGTLLRAVCNKCGYSNIVNFGAGMLNFTEVCNVPVINKKSGKLEIKNILDKDISKENYSFYNEPEMYQGEDSGKKHQWGDIFLSEERNLCPSCLKFTMNFESEGLYD